MKCECDPNLLLEREQQYSRWSNTLGYVWCSDHRVYVPFTAPKAAFDSRIAVPHPGVGPCDMPAQNRRAE